MAHKFSELRARMKTGELSPEQQERDRAGRDALALSRLLTALRQEQPRPPAASRPNISRMEHEEDLYLSVLADYVASFGGRLEVTAVFPDAAIRIGGYDLDRGAAWEDEPEDEMPARASGGDLG